MCISIYVCSFGLCVCMCASWHPPLGHWKTFLPRAFGLYGRRERLIVPQADRRGAHSCHTYKQTHMAQRQLRTQITQAHWHNCTNPYTVKRLHTLKPTHKGLARGQRVRRVSTVESVESEPGQRWSSATHTASVLVPRSRAENKPGPTFSIWPAALPESQPENSRQV